MSTLLMCKDTIVMEIQDSGKINIKEYDLLPFNIRKRDVNVEDFYSQWINNRAITISRTNAKEILNSLRISQTNSSAICWACHGVNFLDTYWLKKCNENLTWKDVNLYENSLNKSLAVTALTGENRIRENGRLHTPELTTQGVSAKSWWREGNEIYLYKVGKKELFASKILDALGIEHVRYEEVASERLVDIVSEERREILENIEEKVVKCKLLSNVDFALVTFEEFAVYCENHGMNPYDEVLKIDAQHYYEMQVADFIISNDDRHVGNWGFYMDNATGQIGKLHPLLDHDHAFSDNKFILSQTSKQDESLLWSAVKAQRQVNLNFDKIREMDCPAGMKARHWERVIANIDSLERQCKLCSELINNNFQPTESLSYHYERICNNANRYVTLKEICECAKAVGYDKEKLGTNMFEFVRELQVQELSQRMPEENLEPEA